MARPRQPIELVIAKGKKHLSKAEIEERRKQEIKASNDNIEAPSYLPNNLKEEFNNILYDLRNFKPQQRVPKSNHKPKKHIDIPTTTKNVTIATIPTFDDTGTSTTTAVFCYATQLEYDKSPMTVGETRAVRFYHPENQTISSASISEVSDCISYQYDEGSDTVYVTALKAGEAKMYIREGNCAFGAYAYFDIVDAPTTTTTKSTGLLGDCDLDGNINSFDIMLMKRAMVHIEYKPDLMDKGDMNKDGKLNSFDIMLIKKVILESK